MIMIIITTLKINLIQFALSMQHFPRNVTFLWFFKGKRSLARFQIECTYCKNTVYCVYIHVYTCRHFSDSNIYTPGKKERKKESRLTVAFESFRRRRRHFDWKRSEVLLGQVSTWQVRLSYNGNSTLRTYGSGSETKRAPAISFPLPLLPPYPRPFGLFPDHCHCEYREESFGCE